MVKITKERMVGFKCEIAFIINGKAFLVYPEIDLAPLYIPDNTNDLYLFSTYSVLPYEMPDGIYMNVEYGLRFKIENIKEITASDLYNCIMQTKEQLQLLFNEIFFVETHKPLVPLIEYEDVENYLIELSESIRRRF